MTLRLIDRYLLRELLTTLAAVTVVLLLVTVGGALTDVLNKVARGRIPAQLLVTQVGLRSLDGLTLLLPLAGFIAVLMAYGRLYRDSEMAALAASGFTSRGLLKPAALVALPLAGLMALLAFWLGPAGQRLADRLLDEANRSLLVVGLEPGRSVELPGRQGLVYVAEMSPDGRRFRRLFVHLERGERVDIVTAAEGELYADRDGAERYLRLSDGFRVEGVPGQPDFRTMRFARNDIRLPDVTSADDGRAEERLGTRELVASERAADRAELHWRLSLPISLLVLVLLALPLARAQPREPRWGKALVALLAYVIYANVLSLGRAWLADGTLPAALGLWWAHVGAIAIALVLLRRGEQLRAPARRSA